VAALDSRIVAISQLIGVSRIAVLTGLDRLDYPVAAAIRPLSKNLSVSFGKGETLEHAKLSAVMEAAELHYSETPPSVLQKATYRHFRAGTALNPSCLEPVDFDIDLNGIQFDWVEGFNLRTRKKLMLPWDVISMDYSTEARKRPRLLQFGATGLAADFDEAKAVLHGLYEVVERDCHNRWNKLPHVQRELTRVDPNSVQDAAIQNLLKKIAEARLQVMVWDMTGPGGMACYLAEVFDPEPHAATAYVQGAAAALTPATALRKALAEALQIRLTYIAGSRDDLDWTDYGDRYVDIVDNRILLMRQVKANSIILPLAEKYEDARSELKIVIRRLQDFTTDTIAVVRLSPVDCPVTVVKVVVPTFTDTPDADDFRPKANVKMMELT
jgi:YcaO-like protein with predicted kinase domain